MTWQPQAAYLQAEVLSSDPVRLVDLLYDLALRSIRNARECCRQNDIAGRGRQINKAFEVLVELSNSLDMEAGAEIAENYARLYDYCQRRLLQAHIEQSDAVLTELEGLIGELKDAWQAVIENCSVRCLTDEEIQTERQAAYQEEPRFNCIG